MWHRGEQCAAVGPLGAVQDLPDAFLIVELCMGKLGSGVVCMAQSRAQILPSQTPCRTTLHLHHVAESNAFGIKPFSKVRITDGALCLSSLWLSPDIAPWQWLWG